MPTGVGLGAGVVSAKVVRALFGLAAIDFGATGRNKTPTIRIVVVIKLIKNIRHMRRLDCGAADVLLMG